MFLPPDANALQTDPAFHVIQALPLTGQRLDSAFDPWSNSIGAPGTVRQRTVHIGVESHLLFMSEYASSTLLTSGASDYLTHPLWATTDNNCTCIGYQFSGTGQYNGWVGLFYFHGRMLNAGEVLAFTGALTNA